MTVRHLISSMSKWVLMGSRVTRLLAFQSGAVSVSALFPFRTFPMVFPMLFFLVVARYKLPPRGVSAPQLSPLGHTLGTATTLEIAPAWSVPCKATLISTVTYATYNGLVFVFFITGLVGKN